MRGAEQIAAVSEQAIENMNLPRNAAKGGWGCLSLRQLFLKLLVECWELSRALWRVYLVRDGLKQLLRSEGFAPDRIAYLAERDRLREDLEKARQHAKHEAGDVVAFAAMIFDRI